MSAAVIDAISELVAADELGAVLTVLKGDQPGAQAVVDATGRVRAGLLPGESGGEVIADAMTLMGREQSMALSYHGVEVFHEVLAPPSRLFVFGAVHIAQELVEHADLLGFHVTVADPRPAFLTPERFPRADELRVGWPSEVVDSTSFDARTFVVVLTHDRRFEDPLWPLVLPSPARYIGAMGSAKTTAVRRKRLIEAGFEPETADRIHGPIGLPIGARSAGEMAIAILGEMIAVRYRVDPEARLHGTPARV